MLLHTLEEFYDNKKSEKDASKNFLCEELI